ncbi:MAG TPA: TRAM domain-containing protein, partial [Micromonosporaceae bacterium]|nr:TRAM domain-containing protein [Micromonosporaceae bacterium]
MTADGDRIELVVGAVAHGGHCVARIGGAGGRVVFVRHALPGERVVAEVTEVRPGYLRADAVEVVEAAPDRVEPPCPWARPGACGGCDVQHVAREAQLAWKAAVVREQFARLAGIDVDVRVAALPGSALGWRSRVRYAVDAAGRPGLFQHRSYAVVPVDRCRIAHPAIQELPVLARRWPDDDAVEVVASSTGDVAVLAGRGPGGAGGAVVEAAVGRRWSLDPRAFWQVHPAAPDTLAGAVLDLLAPAPGETAWDLYGGAGLFASALAGPVGLTGSVAVVEAAGRGVAAARANLGDLPQVRVVAAPVEEA